MSELPDHLAAKLARELDEGEELLWSSQPAQDIVRGECRPFAIVAFLTIAGFSALFVAASVSALLESHEAVRDHGGRATMYVFPAIGVALSLAFVGFGVWCAWAIVHYAAREARETVYAITPRRAIILRAKGDGTTLERDYRPDELIHLARVERKDQRGSLTFESARGANRTSDTATSHKFRAIDDVLEIERMLRRLFGSA